MNFQDCKKIVIANTPELHIFQDIQFKNCSISMKLKRIVNGVIWNHVYHRKIISEFEEIKIASTCKTGAEHSSWQNGESRATFKISTAMP